MRIQSGRHRITISATILVLLLVGSFTGVVHAEDQDVVYLKDGSIIRGTITEQVPNVSLKIRTADGSVFVYQMDKVEKITKVESAAAPAASPATAAAPVVAFKGLKLGVVTAGETWAGSATDDGELSWSIGGFYDYPLSDRLHGGVALDIEEFAFSYYAAEIHTNIAVSLKALIQKTPDKAAWRPGFYLGYGTLSGFDAQFFNVGATLEVVFPSDKSFNWLAELTIIAGPSGGNDAYDMSYGPGVRLRAGMSFK